MKTKAMIACSLGLSVLLATPTAFAQSSPDSIPADSPTPDGTMTPEAQPEPEIAPTEEPITPESTPTPDADADTNIGGADADSGADSEGAKLVSCGPNGAAVVKMAVSPGCHLLKVNSPPGVQ